MATYYNADLNIKDGDNFKQVHPSSNASVIVSSRTMVQKFQFVNDTINLGFTNVSKVLVKNEAGDITYVSPIDYGVVLESGIVTRNITGSIGASDVVSISFGHSLSAQEWLTSLNSSSHSHTNKTILDALSAAGNVLQFKGKTVMNPLDKGYFLTPEALIAAHPSPEAGSKATVGSTDTIWIWDTEGSHWVDSTLQGSVPSVRQIIAGTGLTGGGTLTDNVTVGLGVATSSDLGGVKVGDGLSVDGSGTLTPNFGSVANTVAQGNDSRFHTHSNKTDVLDALTDSSGKLFYKGAAVGEKQVIAVTDLSQVPADFVDGGLVILYTAAE